MTVEQLHFNGFHHLLDLDCVKPPPPPAPHVNWLPWPGARRTPHGVRQEGWLLQIPGFYPAKFYLRQERAEAKHAYLTRLLKACSYLGVEDGQLYDYRQTPPRLLRPNYERLHSWICTGSELVATLRAINHASHPESFYLTTVVGRALCPSCVKEELATVIHAMHYWDIDQEYQVTGCKRRYESDDEVITCDHCDQEIPPARPAY